MVSRDNPAWLAELRAGGAAQKAALDDLREALLRGLRRALPRADAAFLEDMAQDSILHILDRLGQFEGRSRFLTWATSIAIRIAFGELRRHRWKDVSFEDLTAGSDGFIAPAAMDSEPEPGRLSEQRALVAKMYEVIRRDLSEKQRKVLLCELRGMPQAEIARHLGSNRNAIYKLTHDARKRLKLSLEGAGYGGSEVQAAFSN